MKSVRSALAEPPFPAEAVSASAGQERIWLACQQQQSTSSYAIPVGYLLSGSLGAGRLLDALRKLACRHDVLRNSLAWDGVHLTQSIREHVEPPLQVLSACSPAGFQEALTAMAEEPFDLAAPPLLRCLYAEVGGGQSALGLVFHHAICDSWSLDLFMAELAHALADDLPGIPAHDHRSFCARERDWLASPHAERDRSYWRSRLSAETPQLDLGGVAPSRPRHGSVVRFTLAAADVNALTSLQTPTFTGLLSAYFAILRRYSLNDHLSVGLPIAGRYDPEDEQVLGYLSNTIILAEELSPQTSFRQLSRSVLTHIAEGLQHGRLPLHEIIQATGVRRTASEPFTVMFGPQSSPVPATRILAGLRLTPLQVHNGTSKCDLTLNVTQLGVGLECELEYDRDMFEPDWAAAFCRSYRNLVRAAGRAPEVPVDELPLMSSQQRKRALSPRPDAISYERERPAHLQFQERARGRPEAVAVRSPSGEVTYREVDERANRLARTLAQRDGGFAPVAVLLDRGPDLVCTLLGAMKSGVPFVPLDPRFPASRIRELCRDAGVVTIVTEPDRAEQVEGIASVLTPESDYEPEPPQVAVKPGDAAFIYYTSGSTGKPKGVVTDHRCLMTRLAFLRDRYPLTASEAVLHKTPLIFDIALWEIFLPLFAGGYIAVLPSGEEGRTSRIATTLVEQPIALVHFVPAALRAYLNTEEPARSTRLRWVIASGEAVTTDLLARAQAHFGVPVHGQYGQTETAEIAEWNGSEHRRVGATLLGRPVGAYSLHVLDRALQPVPPGVAGELCVAGPGGLAWGYLNRPRLTAERFVAHPDAACPGERLYRSGDLARVGHDGLIEFLGRADQQLKIRGCRVEPGEIQTVMCGHPGVSECAVVARPTGSGEMQLIAYLVGSRMVSVSSLREHALARLPWFMLPTAYVVLEALPKTASGKIDEQRLPSPSRDAFLPAEPVPPEGKLEQAVATEWRRVLGMRELGRADDFFAAGGSSLGAVRVLAALERCFQTRLSVADFMARPTIAALAEAIARASSEAAGAPSTELTQLDSPEPLHDQASALVRLSRDQERLWYLEQLQPYTPQHNVAFELRLESRPSRRRVQRALRELQETHRALCHRLTAVDGVPMQRALSDLAAPLEWHDLCRRDAKQAMQQADAIAAAEARRPIALDSPPLYRATVVALPNSRWRLILVFHHIVVDGWSIGVILEDLARALAGDDLQPASASFAAWAAKQPEDDPPVHVRRYWAHRFSDAPQPTTIAARASTGLDAPRRGGLVPVELSEGLTRRVDELARRQGVSPYVVCLTVFKILLRRMNESGTVVVGAPLAGRNDPALDRVVGFFVQTVALRSELSRSDTFREALRTVNRSVVDAIAHQPMPFDMLVSSAARSGLGESNPLFRIMFAWHDGLLGEFDWNGRSHPVHELDTGTANFDLTVSLGRVAERLSGTMQWSTGGIDEITVTGAVQAFVRIVGSVVLNPDMRIDQLPLAADPPSGRAAREPARGAHLTLADGLLSQLQRTPEATAVIDADGNRFSYTEIGARVAALARRITQSGAAPGRHIGLVLERSVDMLVAVHAVAAAGCAYVPIEPASPPRRMRELLHGAQVAQVLVHGPTRKVVPEGPWLRLDISNGTANPSGVVLRTARAPRSGAAYLLYTSGSTGFPKAVAFPCDSSQKFLDWLHDAVPIGAGDRVLLKTPYGFDVSVWELFWPLQHGAAVVIASPVGHLDPRYLAEVIQRHEVTVANFVPSSLEVFLREPHSRGCNTLRWLLSAGEELTGTVCALAHKRLNASLMNLYGPTECGAVSAYRVPRNYSQRTVPIGCALPGVRVDILDDELQPLPKGLHGQICIAGGEVVAHGYWNDPRRTAQRFVPDPFGQVDGGRLYLTGDLGRTLSNGDLEYLGRMDRQLKVRGVRIEPGEIEDALVTHAGVESCRVLALGPGAEEVLVAFYTPVGPRPREQELRRHLGELLPRHLIPAGFVSLETIPVTLNGKTDVSRLEKIWRSRVRDQRSKVDRREAADSLEQRIASAFEQVLGSPVEDRDVTFFELGGSSLQLLQLAAELEKRTGRALSISRLVHHPSIRAIGQELRDSPPSGEGPVVLVPCRDAPTLVLVHPATGSVLPYLPLSRAIGEGVAVYGLDAPGLGAGTPFPQTVDQFAEALLPLVLAVGHISRLVLAGWSFGGVLAFELTAALHRRGMPPAATVILDAWVPTTPARALDDDDEDALGFLRVRGVIPAELSSRDTDELARVLRATRSAFRAYVPSQVLESPVHLVRANDGYPAREVAGYGRDRGWSEFATDLSIHDAAGDHFGMLAAHRVPDLGRLLREIVISSNVNITTH